MFKRFTTLQARAALLGFELHAINNDFERLAYVATKGAFTREWASLDEVERWLAAEADQPQPGAQVAREEAN